MAKYNQSNHRHELLKVQTALLSMIMMFFCVCRAKPQDSTYSLVSRNNKSTCTDKTAKSDKNLEKVKFQGRPYILTTAAEKPGILAKIEKFDWAAHANNRFHKLIDSKVNKHISRPDSYLSKIPRIGGNLNKHESILKQAEISAVLYYLTEDKKYAQFSADILNVYITEIAKRNFETTTICGGHFEDTRWTYPEFAITYDFIYPFLVSYGTKVYDHKAKKRIPFDNKAAQKAIRNIAGNALQEFSGPDRHGRDVSNHTLLSSRGVLFPILCIEDTAEREKLFDIFWNKGTKKMPSFRNTFLPMYSKFGQGILPESTSYGQVTPLLILNVIDRIKPELNVITDNINILEGCFLIPQLKNPDNTYIRYGDSKRFNDSSINNMRYVQYIADRKGLPDSKLKAETYLRHLIKKKGGPTSGTGGPGVGSLALFWLLPIDYSGENEIDYKSTVIIKHAGVAMLRNYVQKNNFLYGLNGYIGGAHYVHSHCTGIAMELYGAGYIMAPNGGMPGPVSHRANSLHTDYFRLYAGNNTVIVNGTSHGEQRGAWKTESNVWQNNAVNIASEPLHLEDPISENFGFATQYLDDDVNKCIQQRTLSIIRTSPTSGYYLDIFRSRSLDENKFHDYVYHNIGDETSVTNDKLIPVEFSPTDKYDNDIGDLVKSPGCRFFENEQSSVPTEDSLRVRFDVNIGSRFMHMFIPGGVKREYTKALGPATREAKNDYEYKKTQIVVIRQDGEAWDRPFAVVFEPSPDKTPTVTSVRQLIDGDKIKAVEVKSLVNETTITDIIIEQDKANTAISIPEYDIKFIGRFGIVRLENRGKKIENLSLYIGDGSSLSYGRFQLRSTKKHQAFKRIGGN